MVLEETTYTSLDQRQESEGGEVIVRDNVVLDPVSIDGPTASPVSVPETQPEPTGPVTRSRSAMDVQVQAPIPALRRSLRTNAGVHLNPRRLPRSACNAITLSPDALSQLLTSMGAVFFRKAVNEVKCGN